MIDERKVGALILMAGEGLRFGGETPKQFLMLAGKKVYLHTLDPFLRSDLFDEILLVCHPDWLASVREEIRDLPNVRAIPGGSSRQESSYLGLLSLIGCEVVVIHDGVRPFVTEDILEQNVKGALEYGAVDTCIPSADTLVYAPGGKTIEEIPKRAHYLRGQTPQSFRRKLILEAHEKAKGLEATDDCKLVLELGHPIHLVMGEESNIKITTELDLFIAEQLFRLRRPRIEVSKRSLHGKTFAIVGGNGGIGRAISEELRKEGAHPISLSRSSSRFLDLRDPDSITRAFAQLFTEFGPLDGLINCAGKLLVKPLYLCTTAEIKELLAINLEGLIHCCKSAQLKEGAHLINIASSSFTRGRKDLGVYSSAKAGVVNFTQALAEERPDLRVSVVIPQRTNTLMRQEQFPDEDPSSLLDPSEIAKKVIELLSDTRTGQLIEVKK